MYATPPLPPRTLPSVIKGAAWDIRVINAAIALDEAAPQVEIADVAAGSDEV